MAKMIVVRPGVIVPADSPEALALIAARRAAKPAARKLHPGDAYDLSRIPEAVRFAVFFLQAPLVRHRATAATLAEARAIAAEFDRLYGQHGRHAGVYAILPSRESIFVPVDYEGEG